MKQQINNQEGTTYFVPDAKEQIDKALAERINKMVPKNRAQRRALRKKLGKKGYEEFETISETAKKLTMIDLIEKFRELNEKKKDEVYDDEDSEEND